MRFFVFARSTIFCYALPQGDADCHVASLLAMTCRNMRRVSTAMTWCQANSQHFSVFALGIALWFVLPQGERIATSLRSSQ